MTTPAPASVLDALSRVRTGNIIDLAHPLHKATSHYPTHVGFSLDLTRRHGDRYRSDGSSSASCTFRMGSHTGTHLDALGHVSFDGKIFDGADARDISSPSGLQRGGIEQTPPTITAGFLLDIARLRGVDVLPGDYVVTADDLAAASHGLKWPPSATALIRTGWEAHWGAEQYVARETPGPGLEAARWLIDRGVRFVGSDTAVFEKGPLHDGAPVHTELLIVAGVQILENVRLSSLAATGCDTFACVLAPLPIVGGTASPLRPLAVT